MAEGRRPSLTSEGCLTNDEIKNRVTTVFKDFVSDVDPDQLSDWLIGERVITVVRWNEIRTEKTPEKKCRELLLYLLQITHPTAFLVVRKALEKICPHIWERIENQSSLSPEEDSSSRQVSQVTKDEPMAKTTSLETTDVSTGICERNEKCVTLENTGNEANRDLGCDFENPLLQNQTLKRYTELQSVNGERNQFVTENVSRSKRDASTSAHSSSHRISNSDAICPRFQHMMGKHIRRSGLSDTDYLMVKRILYQPSRAPIENSELGSVLPYIVQQIKLWDGNILKASRISKFFTVSTIDGEDMFPGDKCETSTSMKFLQRKQPISRLDVMSYIINAGDCTVLDEILRTLSRFPLAMPLIIPNIKEEDQYIITLPLLKSILIRWETNPKTLPAKPLDAKTIAYDNLDYQCSIVENRLFSSPFRLVVAVRLGSHKTGKSQILNQIMAYPNFFSSRGETDDEFGPPCTLPGSVEFGWLTEETCDYGIWKSLLESHYADGREEIVLLANLHGDANDFPEILRYLKDLASSFIVFIMPDSGPEKLKKFESEIGDKPTIHIKIDHGDSNMIDTSKLTHENTQKKIRELFKRTLELKLDKNHLSASNVYQGNLGKSLRYAEALRTDESEDAIRVIDSYATCAEIRHLMETFPKTEYRYWMQNQKLNQLINPVLNIFSKCKGLNLKKAIIHLEAHLSNKSVMESVLPSRRFAEAQMDLHMAKLNHKKMTKNDEAGDSDIKKLTERMLVEMKSVNDANLGAEHFHRVLGKLYCTTVRQNIPVTREVSNLPKYYADFVLDGNAIELLDGDTGEIPLEWFIAICKQISDRLPNLKVFVISIIGLQSSGKCTLLNALFSCRFAVSAGRCSRGLYMRMIFLEESLKKELNYDAFIIIDTEGLASPEKINDAEADRKDRLLANFAMGLSSLTIVNILDEEAAKLTEIVQNVIATMARLRQVGLNVKPDIIVVQHLQERDSRKLNQAKRLLIDAIERAIEILEEMDVEIGATENECLRELVTKIQRQDHDMFLQFSSFKNGSSVHAPPSESYHKDVVNLYQILLVRAKASDVKLSFQRWFQLTENYWNCVTQEKFALLFKNAKHITEFLYYSKKTAQIKELVEKVFRFHRDLISKAVVESKTVGLTGERDDKLETLREEVAGEISSELYSIPCYECENCKCLHSQREELTSETKDTDWEREVNVSIDQCIENKREYEANILKQIFDTSLFRQGCISEFSHLITQELKKELKNRPGGKLNDSEKERIAESIWSQMEQIAASKESGLPFLEDVENAIQAEYGDTHPEICKQIKNNLLSDDDILEEKPNRPISRMYQGAKGYITGKGYMTPEGRVQLIQSVENAISNILLSSNPQCHEIGMKFEASMITILKTEIPTMIQNFESESKIKLSKKNKISVILYILRTFTKQMKKVQDLWDSGNRPTMILLGKKEVYMKEIKTRLDYGFSSATDGYV